MAAIRRKKAAEHFKSRDNSIVCQHNQARRCGGGRRAAAKGGIKLIHGMELKYKKLIQCVCVHVYNHCVVW